VFKCVQCSGAPMLQLRITQTTVKFLTKDNWVVIHAKNEGKAAHPSTAEHLPAE